MLKPGITKGTKRNPYKKRKESKVSKYTAGTQEYYRDRWLWHKYKITLDEYNNLFQNQNGKCNICKRHQSELDKILYLDHCHNTNKIRGLLCHRCNLGLGKFNDNIEFLKNAVEYLKINQ